MKIKGGYVILVAMETHSNHGNMDSVMSLDPAWCIAIYLKYLKYN